MPWKTKRGCKYSGCPELVTNGAFCEKHKRELYRRTDERRGTSSERGYDIKWRRLRTWWINQNPLCVHCQAQGLLVMGEHVDHIKPFHGKSDPLRLDATNLQTLCKSCHSKKTIKEDGGFGR